MTKWTAGLLELELDDTGKVSLWAAPADMKKEFAPMAHVLMAGALQEPVSAEVKGSRVALMFPSAQAELEISVKDSYLRLVVTSISGKADGWIWGPYPVILNGGCGEIVGAAWNGEYAIGLQSLNPKTVGGFPMELAGRHPMGSRVIDRAGQREPAAACAALPIYDGAALQAFARNRTRPARRDYYYAKNALVLPLRGFDAVIEGSAIALYGCKADEILPAIGEIEAGEGLPHPMVDGVWGKRARNANASYLITDFSEETFDEALEFAGASGLECVYHLEPFASWGHFELSKWYFPQGEAGMKACVEKASRHGIHVGIHTLSSFTTTNDPYVTPVPHPKLLKMGGTVLIGETGAEDGTLYIRDDAFFSRLSLVNAARLGNELVHYANVERLEGGIALTGCERGAWGTGASAHAAGEPIWRLWDYDYRTLFPDAELQREYSRRLGELFVGTGIERMSFDGLLCDYTGHDEYANSRFTQDCYDVWGPGVRSDASSLSHYRWHLHNYMNWGEPWYADMRNGMYGFRVSSQAYFKRNLLPPMMGWYTLRLATRKYESTTPDDIEWMLSKAAGFSAGFAFHAKMETLRSHGRSGEYMNLIRLWEAMRLSGNIPEKIRLEMQDQKSEWHIEEAPGGWLVRRAAIMPFECSPEGAQPGMPTGGDWQAYNPYKKQKMRFRLRAGEGRDRGTVVNPSFNAGEELIAFEARIDAGQYLIYDGGLDAVVCDADFNTLRVVKGKGSPLTLGECGGMLLFRCVFEGIEPPYPQVKVFSYDVGTFVPAQ